MLGSGEESLDIRDHQLCLSNFQCEENRPLTGCPVICAYMQQCWKWTGWGLLDSGFPSGVFWGGTPKYTNQGCTWVWTIFQNNLCDPNVFLYICAFLCRAGMFFNGCKQFNIEEVVQSGRRCVELGFRGFKIGWFVLPLPPSNLSLDTLLNLLASRFTK